MFSPSRRIPEYYVILGHDHIIQNLLFTNKK